MKYPRAAFGVTPSRGRHLPSGKAGPALPLDGASSCVEQQRFDMAQD
ncbi:hypothetical protein [Hydrogenophaga palleronii]|nr:hypothetical protein [Hydrogenophaga palleronii]